MSIPLVDKYCPKTLVDLIGQAEPVKTIQAWLDAYKQDSTNIMKMLIISGPPGSGKTSAARLILEQSGYSVIELNGSDSRKKSSIEDTLQRITGQFNVLNLMRGSKNPSALLLDDIDSMREADKGGIPALTSFLKSKEGIRLKTPIICTYQTWCKAFIPLEELSVTVRFNKLSKHHCKQLLNKILKQEKIGLNEKKITEIINNSQGDLRAMINTVEFMLINNKEEEETSNEDDFVIYNPPERDVTLQTNDIIVKLLRDKNVTMNDCIKYNSLDAMQIPLKLHENYPQILSSNLAKLSEKEQYAIHSEILDGLIEYDHMQSDVFKYHNWQSSIYSAILCLYRTNRHISEIAYNKEVKIIASDALNKIQMSNTNAGLIENIKYMFHFACDEEQIFNISELLTSLLFIKREQLEAKEDTGGVREVISKAASIMDHYKIPIAELSMLVRLSRFSADTYKVEPKIKRMLIIAILETRLEDLNLDISTEDLQKLAETVCVHFTGKAEKAARQKAEDKIKKLAEKLNISLELIEQLYTDPILISSTKPTKRSSGTGDDDSKSCD